MDSSLKRSRTSNYSEKELEILTDDATVNQTVLNAPFSSAVTNALKMKVWQGIADKINATCGTNRSAVQLRKKWNDYKCQLRRKVQKVRKEVQRTGGGPAPDVPFSDVEQKVISLIPTCKIDGIQGGLETPVDGITPEDTESVFVFPSTSETCIEASTCIAQQSPEPTAIDTVTCQTPIQLTFVQPRKEDAKGKIDNVERLVELDAERVELMRELVAISRERLVEETRRRQLEERRLAVEERRLEIEENKLNF